jgi:hypothetical protein
VARSANRYELLSCLSVDDGVLVTFDVDVPLSEAPSMLCVTPCAVSTVTVPLTEAPVMDDAIGLCALHEVPCVRDRVVQSARPVSVKVGRLTRARRYQITTLIGRELQYCDYSSCYKAIPVNSLFRVELSQVRKYVKRVPVHDDAWHGAFVTSRIKRGSVLYNHIVDSGFVHVHDYACMSVFYRPITGQRVLHEHSTQVPTLSALDASAKLHRYAVKLHNFNVACDAWIDSCASACCISEKLVRMHKMKVIPVTDMHCQLGDSSTIPIRGIVMLRTSVGYLKCLVVNDLPIDLILGMAWLTQCNPAINWVSGAVTLDGVVVMYPKGQHFAGDVCNPILLTAMQFKRVIKQKGAQAFLVTVDVVSAPEHVPCDVQLKPDHAHFHTVNPLLERYKGVFNAPTSLPPDRGKFNYKVVLQPDAVPFARTPWRLSPAEEAELIKQVTELLEQNFIEPSISPWAAPILFVRKKPDPVTGEVPLRMCIDYRGLNKCTVKDKFPLPNISELLNDVGGHRYYSTLDLKSGYHQMLLDPDSRDLTTFVCKLGTFRYNVLPFGLTNGPPHFSRLISSLFSTMKGVRTYIDDIIVYANSVEEHARILEDVFRKLEENSLFLKFSKCTFLQESTQFLGHVVSEAGVHTDSRVVQAVRDFPVPAGVSQLRSFLGMCNYYRKFVRNYATIAQPLTDLLKGPVNRPMHVLWTDAVHGKAFTALKDALCTAPVLRVYDNKRETCIFTDASQAGVGACVCQRDSESDTWHPVEYASKRFNDAESRYPVHEQELLALVFALRHFRHYLLGVHFTCFTDHRSLTRLQSQANLSPRQARWLETLSEYDYVVEYLSGSKNVLADALSRLFALVSTPDASFVEKVIAAYPTDPQLAKLSKSLILHEGLYFHGEQVYIPASLRVDCMREHHDTVWSAHPGYLRTHEFITRHFWWPKMRADILHYVTTCPSCQHNKPVNHKRQGLMDPFTQPDVRWDVISTDLITGLPVSVDGYDCIVTFVDKMSKMVHFIPCMSTIDAKGYADVFLRHVFRLHGLPGVIISDRDPRFTSQFWGEFSECLKMRLNMSTSHYAETDGQTERMHRTVEEALRHFVAYSQDKWSDYLPLCEFAMNNLQNRTTGFSPFYLNYGMHPRVPGFVGELQKSKRVAGDYVSALHDALDKANELAEYAADKAAAYVNKSRKDVDFEVGDEVLVTTQFMGDTVLGSPKLRCNWVGPFKVTAKCGKNAYRIHIPPVFGRVHNVFHAHRLRKYMRDDAMHPVLPHPPPVLVDGAEEHEVEAVIGKRRMGRGVQYLIKWYGFEHEHNTWEPLRNLKNCMDLVDEFNARQKG